MLETGGPERRAPRELGESVPMPAGPFRRILVGWDSSADAAAALAMAVSLAGGEEAHVVALAVVPGVPHAEASEDRAREIAARRSHTERLFDQARAAIPAASRARVSLHIITERDAARAVCEYATGHGFDLLVLGRHGSGRGALHPRLGHIAAAAVKASKVPILLLADR